MNETTPKISVIVPVYKAEAYLHPCVDSILAQTSQNFEVLLIDDGSPDRSGEICDEYARKDRRVRVFHKENGGVSSARNMGLDNARGKYVCFVDSDDSVGVYYLEHLLEGEDDIVVTGLSFVSREGERIKHHIPNAFQTSQKNKVGNCIPNLESLILLNGPYQKRFKRKLLHEHRILFDLECSSGEDTLFVLEYMQYVESIRVISCSDYYYYNRGGSLSKQRSLYFVAYNFARKMFLLRSSLIQKFAITDRNYLKRVSLLYQEYLCVSVYSLYYQQISKKERLFFLEKVYSDNRGLKLTLNRKLHFRNAISIILLKLGNVQLADWIYSFLFKFKW